MRENIVILSPIKLPMGMASTTRILTYSKGLFLNGADVQIVSFNLNDGTSPFQGEIDGVKFTYAHKNTQKTRSFFVKVYDFFTSMNKAGNIIHNLEKVKQIDSLFLSFDYIPCMFFFRLKLWSLRKKLVFVCDEYPVEIRDKGQKRLTVFQKICYRIAIADIPKRLAINSTLKDYYNHICGVKPTFILPTIVDVDRFMKVKRILTDKVLERRLVYVGGMNITNDDILFLISAYKQVAFKYSDVHLYLYGKPSEEHERIIRGFINENCLSDKVSMMGYVKSDEVPQILCNAHVLLTAQRNDLRANGGLPTKLGEYLMSGTPSIHSDISEISKAFQDGENIFLAKADDIDDYVSKLSFILENYDLALKVAHEGRDCIIKRYSTQIMTKKLIEFLRQYN